MYNHARSIDPAEGVNSDFTKSIYSYAGIAEARLRINPKIRYGVDIHLSYSPGLRVFTSDVQPITGNHALATLVKANMINQNDNGFIQSEVNIYFNPRRAPSVTDRGGLY